MRPKHDVSHVQVGSICWTDKMTDYVVRAVFTDNEGDEVNQGGNGMAGGLLHCCMVGSSFELPNLKLSFWDGVIGCALPLSRVVDGAVRSSWIWVTHTAAK